MSKGRKFLESAVLCLHLHWKMFQFHKSKNTRTLPNLVFSTSFPCLCFCSRQWIPNSCCMEVRSYVVALFFLTYNSRISHSRIKQCVIDLPTWILGFSSHFPLQEELHIICCSQAVTVTSVGLEWGGVGQWGVTTRRNSAPSGFCGAHNKRVKVSSIFKTVCEVWLYS